MFFEFERLKGVYYDMNFQVKMLLFTGRFLNSFIINNDSLHQVPHLLGLMRTLD